MIKHPALDVCLQVPAGAMKRWLAAGWIDVSPEPTPIVAWGGETVRDVEPPESKPDPKPRPAKRPRRKKQ